MKYGKGTFAPKFKTSFKKRKFRFPVAFHLIQAVGALTLHTGVGTICYTMGIKNANGIVGELSRLYKMECTANIGRFFGIAIVCVLKKYRKCYLCGKIVRNMRTIIQFIKENSRSRDIYIFLMSFAIGMLASMIAIMAQ